jgi:hypothetical protein
MHVLAYVYGLAYYCVVPVTLLATSTRLHLITAALDSCISLKGVSNRLSELAGPDESVLKHVAVRWLLTCRRDWRTPMFVVRSLLMVFLHHAIGLICMWLDISSSHKTVLLSIAQRGDAGRLVCRVPQS